VGVEARGGSRESKLERVRAENKIGIRQPRKVDILRATGIKVPMLRD
jgi:hypothetical protein